MPKQSSQLQFLPRTIVDVPFDVLVNAKWRPQALRFLEKVGDSPEGKLYRAEGIPVDDLLALWRREETWVNHALNALLLSLPPQLLADVIAPVCGGQHFTQPEVMKLDYATLRKVTGEPDFIVMDSANQGSAVLGESKVKTHEDSARYSFIQYTKYVALGVIAKCRKQSPSQDVRHLLLVPSERPKEFCSDFQQWSPRVEGGRLTFDVSGVQLKGKNLPYQDGPSWRRYLVETLMGPELNAACPLDGRALAGLVEQGIESAVPTHVVTWGVLMDRIHAVCRSSGLTGASAAATALAEMALAGLVRS